VRVPIAKNAVKNSSANVEARAFQPKPIQETVFRPAPEKRHDTEKKNVPEKNTSPQPKSSRKKNDGKAATSIESAADSNEQNHTRELLLLIGLGVLFLIVPILVIGILLSYRGDKTPSKNKHIRVPQQQRHYRNKKHHCRPTHRLPICRNKRRRSRPHNENNRKIDLLDNTLTMSFSGLSPELGVSKRLLFFSNFSMVFSNCFNGVLQFLIKLPKNVPTTRFSAKMTGFRKIQARRGAKAERERRAAERYEKE
jgi:hypothetical protein